eukprot:TRINITY_DN4461_c0_g1_i2.p2 TRINITY_DN4461_c0_g1~~TRINITY_DN4461_c0_g1_i2.p2  ORF type:complete len:105 (+),score=11.72 TRINITY_DN4461_c0_g1_i2:175-489(+)
MHQRNAPAPGIGANQRTAAAGARVYSRHYGTSAAAAAAAAARRGRTVRGARERYRLAAPLEEAVVLLAGADHIEVRREARSREHAQRVPADGEHAAGLYRVVRV